MTVKQNGKERVSAIVCAYNEEENLAGVLTALGQSPLLDEIIVVDDGSQDGTAQIIKQFEARGIIRGIIFAENRGKSAAMAEGIRQALSEVVLFIDADHHNFGPEYVATILEPFFTTDADMVIGWPRRNNGGLLDVLDPCRPLSGQRVMWREHILPIVPLFEESGYGVETLINLSYKQADRKTIYVPLDGLYHPIKTDKAGPMAAVGHYAFEIGQILWSIIRHYPLTLSAFGMWPSSGVNIVPRHPNGTDRA